MSDTNSISGRDLVVNFLKKQPVPRMPVFSGMGHVTVTGLEQCNVRFAHVHGDAREMADTAATSHTLYGFDCVVVPYDLGVEAEALGAKLNTYSDTDDLLYPTLREKTVEDAAGIKVPDDLENAGRIPVVCEAIRLLKAELGDSAAVGTYVLGPFVLAGQIMDLNMLLKKSLREQKEVDKMLAILSEVIIDVANIYKRAGADYVTVREMGSSADILSPRVFRKLIKSHLTHIHQNIELPNVLHICGNTNAIVADMVECGADAISIDQKNDMAESRQKLGPDVLILGNIDPYNVLVLGDRDQVVTSVQESVANGASAVWPGCDVWPTAPAENMRTFADTIKEN
ncbi:MAG: methyltransferase [Rhodobacteraceae bacterium]|nr:methyltransferase [Paracoccaceae bacterium]